MYSLEFNQIALSEFSMKSLESLEVLCKDCSMEDHFGTFSMVIDAINQIFEDRDSKSLIFNNLNFYVQSDSFSFLISIDNSLEDVFHKVQTAQLNDNPYYYYILSQCVDSLELQNNNHDLLFMFHVKPKINTLHSELITTNKNISIISQN